MSARRGNAGLVVAGVLALATPACSHGWDDYLFGGDDGQGGASTSSNATSTATGSASGSGASSVSSGSSEATSTTGPGSGGAGTGGGAGGPGQGGGGSSSISSTSNASSSNASTGSGPVSCGAGAFDDPATGHCYFYIAGWTATWFEAFSECTSKGPGWTLVGISSAAEHAFLKSEINAPPDNIWTSGNDSGTEGVYEWANGEPWAYEGWGPDDPDGMDGQDCIMLEPPDLGFNDRGCDSAYDYMCERPPP